jgi:hypothetical protein
MGFLVPAFLAGLVALAVPLLMHLRDRNEESPQRFPSLMFLVRLPIRSADRRRVTDWPLLLLRALAVMLLVLAFARPYAGSVGTVESGDRTRAVVLALDRSLSMSYEGTWDAALDSARAVLDGLGANDQVALVLFDAEASVEQGWTADHGAVRTLLASALPSAQGTRYGAALRAARGLLSAAPPAAREVVLVSDLQRSGLVGTAGLEWPADVPLRTVAVGEARRANVAVSAVEARRVASGDRVTLQAQARIVARELPAPRSVRATLSVGGRDVATRDLSLDASGERTVVFDAVAAPVGTVQGSVRLSADALGGDDVYHFTLAAQDELRVMLVVPDNLERDETLFLERALAIGRAPGVRVERRRAGTLDAAALDRAALVMLWDVAPPTGASADALLAWTQSGGGVLMHVGPRLAARRALSLLELGTTGGSADRRASGGGVLGEHRSDHPIFTPFRSTPAALGAPRFWRYARVEPAAGTEVLARLDDGAPVLIERREGEGRLLLNTLPLDARDGDLPLQPAFLPLMRRLALHLSGYESVPMARATGDAWVPRGIRREPVVVAPDAAQLRPESGDAGPAVLLALPGVYAAYEGRVDGAPRAVVAVNAPPQESDLTRADPRELLLGVGTVSDSSRHAGPAAAALELETRQRGWRILLLLAAIALLAESVLGARGWRAQARRATIEGVGGTPG